ILEAGSPAQKKDWLPRIAAGEAKAALAWTEPNARWDAAGVTATARASKDGFVLTGTKLFVLDAHLADVIVVVARGAEGRSPEDGVGLFLVEKGAKGMTVKLLPTMDQTRKLCEVGLKDVAVGAAAVLGAKDSGWRPLARDGGALRRDVWWRPEGPRDDHRVREDPGRLRQADRDVSGRQA